MIATVRTGLLALGIGCAAAAAPAQTHPPGFIGQLVYGPGDCPRADQVVLLQDFGFRDRNGVEWQAAAGNCTDGASIPGWAQGIVGGPFEADVIRAAVIHDHYCDRRVRSWPETHRVFYDALRVHGMPRGKAMTMYFAVLAGGPKWIRLIEARPCTLAGLGAACIMQVPATPLGDDVSAIVGDGPVRMALRAARYDTPEFETALAGISAELAQRTDLDALSADEEAALLDALRRRAEAVIGPDSAFVRHAEGVMPLAPGPAPAADR